MLLKKWSITWGMLLSCVVLCGQSVVMPLQAAEPNLPPVFQNATLGQQDLSALLPKEVTPYFLPTLNELYAAHNMQPMWQDHQVVEAFQQQLAELVLSGVQPRFNQWVTWLTDPAVSGMARDIILSDAMLGYLQFTSSIDSQGSRWLYSSVPYKMELPASTVIQQWQMALKNGTLAAYIDTLAPQHPQYGKMHQALRQLLADNRPWPKLASQSSIRPGQTSTDMVALTEILQRTGMLTPDVYNQKALTPEEVALANTKPVLDDLAGDEEPKEQSATTTAANHVVSPTTASIRDIATPPKTVSKRRRSATVADPYRYTAELVAGVKRFQYWHGLNDDGVIGGRTRDWLSMSSQQRAALLALNIQRLRLLPAHPETQILVNIPNYSLSYYINGAEVLSSKVIVGRPSRKTPLMSSALSNVVVNPPWNVPAKLIREDIVPKAEGDSSYFQRHGYTLIAARGGNSSAVVDPASIDWNNTSAHNFPYHIRQTPGSSNSLGRFKFNMPSSDAIYLHDTPNHGLFQKDIRALSSGCVRVNKAADLANMLLQDAGWNDARISSTLKRGNTTSVGIRQPIPVQLYYLTAWIADDGKPQFRTDIYNYDVTTPQSAQILPKVEILLQ